jgi:hypothetical protein
VRRRFNTFAQCHLLTVRRRATSIVALNFPPKVIRFTCPTGSKPVGLFVFETSEWGHKFRCGMSGRRAKEQIVRTPWSVPGRPKVPEPKIRRECPITDVYRPFLAHEWLGARRSSSWKMHNPPLQADCLARAASEGREQHKLSWGRAGGIF